MGRSRRRWIAIGVSVGSVAALVGAGIAAAGWYRAGLVDAARERGFALFDEGRYADALDPLSYYVSRRRDDAEALVRLGTARASVFRENNRHLVSAAGFLEAALKVNPNDPAALRALLPIYRQLGYRTELLRVADVLLKLDPRDARAVEARLAARVEQGAWPAAAGDAELLVELEPEVVSWRGALLDILRFGDRPIDQRLAIVDLWIAGGEPDGRYRLLRAEQFMLDGKLEEAKSECVLAAERGIADLASLERLVEIMQMIGLSEELERTLAVSRERFGAELLARLDARLQFLGGRHEQAIGSLDQLWASGERAVDLGKSRVIAAELAGDPERADRAMSDLEALAVEGSGERDNLLAWTRAVRASRPVIGPSRRDGTPTSPAQRREAREALIRGLQAWQDDSFLLYRHGEMNLAAGEYAAARQLFEAAFQRESRRWALAGIRAAHSALRAGSSDASFRLSREVVGRHPRNVLAYVGLAESLSALSREGRVPSMVDPTLPRGLTASAILAQVYEAIDRDFSILVPYVAALLDEGRSEEALDVALEAASREKPEIPVVAATVGPLLESGEIEGVEELVRKLRSADADSFDVKLAAIDLLIARGELNRAAEDSAALVVAVEEDASELPLALRQACRIGVLRDDPAAVALLSRYLRVADGDPDAASFVLGQVATWSDEALVRQAIDRMSDAGGERSQQVVLAEATRTLAFRRGDSKALAAAIVEVNQLLRADPNSPAALIVLSRLISASIPPDWMRASAFLAKAVDLQPRDTSLYPELVVLLQKAGNTVDATRYLQQYLRLSGQDQEASRRAARLLLNQGAFVEAIPALERLSGRSGGEGDLLAFAEANRAAGRITAAENAYREAATRPGRSSVAVQAYAEFLARLGRLEEGRRVIRADAEGAPPVLGEVDRAIFLFRLESIYGTTESMVEANRLLSSITVEDPRIAALRAQQAMRRGDDDEALRLAEQALGKYPDDESLLGMTASLLISRSGDRDRAGALLDRLGKTRPEWQDLMEVLRTAGGEGAELDLSPETLANAVQLTENHPLFAEGWSFAVSLHRDAGRDDDALRLARRALSRLPSEPSMAAMTADLLRGQGRIEEAREAARAWRRLVPENTIDADAFIAELSLASSPAEAVSLLRPHAAMLRSEPERNASPLAVLVMAELATGNRDAAREIALAHSAVGPILAAWTRGSRAAEAAEAKEMLDRIPLEGLSDPVRLGIAAEYSALATRGLTAAVESARNIMADLPPEMLASPLARLLAADLLAAAGQSDEAARAYESLVGGVPPAVVVSLETSAPGSLEADAEGIRTQIVYALNNSAALQLGSGRDRESGLRTLDRALRIWPGNPSLLDTRAQILLAKGDLVAARTAAAAATTSDRNSLSAWLTLAEVDLAAGKPDTVERALREIERVAAGSVLVERQAVERRRRVESELGNLRSARDPA
jgi:tetratricopeptide (TPR) repeat protein